MTLTEHAQRELELIGAFTKEGDFYGGMTGNAVMELVKVFAAQGHSGMSASLVADLFKRCALYEPLSPLTGKGDEWMDVGAGTWQNLRCSHVFKDASGTYDINGRIFRHPNGACFTSKGSRLPVTFPYTPKREYVDVPDDEPPQEPPK